MPRRSQIALLSVLMLALAGSTEAQAPAATPAELAVNAVAQNDPATLSISDWEFVLALREASPANRQAADKVWAAIQAAQAKALLKLPIKVIALTPRGFDGAIGDDSLAKNRADVHVTLLASNKPPPAQGAALSVIGFFTDYTLNPFRFVFEERVAPTP